jgi:hypothetical protein
VPSQTRVPTRCKKCTVLRFGALPASRRNQRAGSGWSGFGWAAKARNSRFRTIAPRLVQSSKTFARHYCFF